MTSIAFLPLLLLAAQAAAETPPPAPDPAALVEEHSRPFAYTAEALTGPGAEFLRQATAGSQFVLLGEGHLDHEVPIFAGALYGMLHRVHGFRTVVVEQDPIAIEDALAAERRGDPEKLARHARRYNTLYEFDSDEDLSFVARAARLKIGRSSGRERVKISVVSGS